MIFALLTVCLLAQSPTVPITVLSSSVDLTEEMVTFTVRNDADKPITAWHVSIQVGVDGDALKTGWGVDAYRSFAGLGPIDDALHIPAMGTVTATARLFGQLRRPFIFPKTVVVPTSALFADNTFAGDERDARFVFKLRAQHAAEWRQVLDILERALDRGAPAADTLEFIRDQLDRVITKQPEALALKMVRPNVGIFIRQVREGTSSAEHRLEFLLDQARRELAAAIAHSPH